MLIVIILFENDYLLENLINIRVDNKKMQQFNDDDIERERLEKERLEKERLEREMLEKQRIEKLKEENKLFPNNMLFVIPNWGDLLGNPTLGKYVNHDVINIETDIILFLCV